MIKKQHLKGKFPHLRVVDSVTLFHGRQELVCVLSPVSYAPTHWTGAPYSTDLVSSSKLCCFQDFKSSIDEDSVSLRKSSRANSFCSVLSLWWILYCMIKYKLSCCSILQGLKDWQSEADTQRQSGHWPGRFYHVFPYIHTHIHTYSLLMGLVTEKTYLKSHEIKKLNDSFGT